MVLAGATPWLPWAGSSGGAATSQMASLKPGVPGQSGDWWLLSSRGDTLTWWLMVLRTKQKPPGIFHHILLSKQVTGPLQIQREKKQTPCLGGESKMQHSQGRTAWRPHLQTFYQNNVNPMNYVRVNDTLDTEMLLSWYFFFFCTLGTVRINNEMSSASVSEGPDSKQCRLSGPYSYCCNCSASAIREWKPHRRHRLDWIALGSSTTILTKKQVVGRMCPPGCLAAPGLEKFCSAFPAF